ncbi:MAG: D-alanine--D-alanine ligase [Candidatus Tectimicrobiota bacterium]
MKIALTYNLRPACVPAASPWDDTYAEWDEPATIAAVAAALAAEHEVVLIEATEGLVTQLRAARPQMVFNLAEGLLGADREACLPALLEHWRLPFTGSSALTLRHCLDKAAAKRILRQHGLPTPDYAVVTCLAELQPPAAFPVMVKPLHEGSSKGIFCQSLVSTWEALRARVAYVLRTYRQPALVETFLPGREFTVALLGNGAEVTVLPLVEIRFAALPAGAAPIYSYEAKWLWDTVEHPLDIFDCPAALCPELADSISRLCRQAFLALGCRDWCRIDVRLDASGQPSILELNPLPGILPDLKSHSCFPRAAAAAHLAYPEMIRRVLALACQRYHLSC